MACIPFMRYQALPLFEYSEESDVDSESKTAGNLRFLRACALARLSAYSSSVTPHPLRSVLLRALDTMSALEFNVIQNNSMF